MATERSPKRQRGANDRDARWRVKRVSRPCGTAGARGRGTRRRKARIGVGSRGRGWTRGWARGWRGPARDGACWLGGGLRALPEPGAGPRARPPPPRRPLRGLAPSRALGSGWGGRARARAGAADRRQSFRAHVRSPSRGRGPRPCWGGGGGSGARRTMAADAGRVGAGASSGAGMEEAGLWGSVARGSIYSSGSWRPFTIQVIFEQVRTAIKG